MPDLALSIVSHGHGAMVARLLADLRAAGGGGLRLVLTLNRPEPEPFLAAADGFDLMVVRNPVPRGFGANHNAAFAAAGPTRQFVVLNPDLRLPPDFRLADCLAAAAQLPTGVVAPVVRTSAGSREDSARRFPSLAGLAARHVAGRRHSPYPVDAGPVAVDWVAGMFMAFDAPAFAAVGGFDESYFMYLEDADICRRLARAGFAVTYDPRFTVIHDAQRASRRDVRHLRWHIASMARFLLRG